MLSGLPLPDIRGTMGTFSYYAHRPEPLRRGQHRDGRHPQAAGLRRRRRRERARSARRARSCAADRGDPRARVRRSPTAIARSSRSSRPRGRPRPLHAQLEQVGEVRHDRPSTDRRFALEQGKWTPWIDLDFKVNFIVRLHGMVQMLLMNAGNELQLYVSPVNFKPDAPPVPISSPASFSADLYKRSATTGRWGGPKRPGR